MPSKVQHLLLCDLYKAAGAKHSSYDCPQTEADTSQLIPLERGLERYGMCVDAKTNWSLVQPAVTVVTHSSAMFSWQLANSSVRYHHLVAAFLPDAF